MKNLCVLMVLSFFVLSVHAQGDPGRSPAGGPSAGGRAEGGNAGGRGPAGAITPRNINVEGRIPNREPVREVGTTSGGTSGPSRQSAGQHIVLPENEPIDIYMDEVEKRQTEVDRGAQGSSQNGAVGLATPRSPQSNTITLRVSSKTSTAIRNLLNDYSTTRAIGTGITFAHLANMIYGWIDDPRSDPTANDIVDAADLIKQFRGGMNTQMQHRIQDLRWESTALPSTDQRALQLLFELFYNPDAFTSEGFTIEGNTIIFIRTPFKDRKHTIKVNRQLASMYYDQLEQLRGDPQVDMGFLYLTFGSSWHRKLRETVGATGIATFELSEREYQMMRAALYNLNVSEGMRLDLRFKRMAQGFQDSESFGELVDTAGVYTDDGFHLKYWYPLREGPQVGNLPRSLTEPRDVKR